MSSLFDLDPQEDDPLPAAVAMHAHEYVHFLHNASTTAGQAYLHSNLILLRAMAGGCNDQGYFLGLDKMSEEGRNFLCYATTIMNAQLGTTSAKSLSGCKEILQWEYDFPRKLTSDNASIAISTFKVHDENGTTKSQDITIGLSFVTEGVAYEIDREMRRLSGTPDNALDLQVPIFPYLTYREAIQSWSGRDLQTHDLIAIGITALSHILPGFWLCTICDTLRNTSESVISVLEKARATCRNDSERVLAALREQRNDLSKGDVIWTAIGEYMKMAESGAELRQKNWAPEFSLISKPLTPEEFRGFIGMMLDCLVIQGKPNGALDMYWIGPGLIARDDNTASCLGALQSALHFNQLHLKTDGSAVSTAELKSKPTPCPFSGGCQQERNDQYPDACKTSPWMRFATSSPGEQVCWYAAGVKALRNQANTSSDD
ncbi:hypothetical protein A3N37_02015 [Enterobacter ludwigii]|nr:hypothetical protein A3N37_02015 [Enterobacter ludwigii]